MSLPRNSLLSYYKKETPKELSQTSSTNTSTIVSSKLPNRQSKTFIESETLSDFPAIDFKSGDEVNPNAKEIPTKLYSIPPLETYSTSSKKPDNKLGMANEPNRSSFSNLM